MQQEMVYVFDKPGSFGGVCLADAIMLEACSGGVAPAAVVRLVVALAESMDDAGVQRFASLLGWAWHRVPRA